MYLCFPVSIRVCPPIVSDTGSARSTCSIQVVHVPSQACPKKCRGCYTVFVKCLDREVIPIDCKGTPIERDHAAEPKGLDPISANVNWCVKLSMIQFFVEREGLGVLSNFLDTNPCRRGSMKPKEEVAERSERRKVIVKYTDHFHSLITRTVFSRQVFTVLPIIVLQRREDRVHVACHLQWQELGKLCPVPEPVKQLLTVIRRVRLFIRDRSTASGTANCFVYGGDFRHWFQQIAAPPWLQTLRAEISRDTLSLLLLTSLPMGWSWSPVLAQASAWLCWHTLVSTRSLFRIRLLSVQTLSIREDCQRGLVF